MQHFVTLLNQSLAQLGRHKPAFHTITTATACTAALAAYEVPSVFRLPKGGFHATSFS